MMLYGAIHEINVGIKALDNISDELVASGLVISSCFFTTQKKIKKKKKKEPMMK